MALRGSSGVSIAGPVGKISSRSNSLRGGSQKIETPAKPPGGTKQGLRTDTTKVTIQSPQNHSNGNGALPK